MAKEPWEEDIYEEEEMNLQRTSKKTVAWANRLLTILAIIFVIIVLGIGATLFYLSSGGTSSKNVTEGFYSTEAVAASAAESTPAPEEAASEQTEDSSATTEESSTVASGPGTISVLAGEGEAAIAARAGISIAQLEALNPEHMTRGYWYANPGDVVKTQ